MANELRAYHASGKNLYACIFNTSGNVWYVVGEVFEAWGTGDRDADDYDIALTDKSGSLYLGDWDSNLTTVGYYYVIYYKRAGESAVDGDYAIDHEEGYWTGSVWLSTAKQLQAIVTDTNEIQEKLPTNYIMGSDDVSDHNAELEDWEDGGRLDTILDGVTTSTSTIITTQQSVVNTYDTRLDRRV